MNNKARELFASRNVVLLDGALGTEIQKMGVDIDSHPLWSAHALNNQNGREIITEIHRQYERAGANIVTANTFRLNPVLLDRYGLLDQADNLIVSCVDLARNAVEKSLIAGSMSPLESCYSPELVPSEGKLFESHLQTVEWFSKSGIDLILAETISTIKEARAILKAVDEFSFPHIISFCCDKNGRLFSGEHIDEIVNLISDNTLAIGVNCSDMKGSLKFLDQLKRNGCKNFGLYPNFGRIHHDGVWRADDISDTLLKNHVKQWIREGVIFFGGCCGSTPKHIQLMNGILKEVL